MKGSIEAYGRRRVAVNRFEICASFIFVLHGLNQTGRSGIAGCIFGSAVERSKNEAVMRRSHIQRRRVSVVSQ